MAVRLLNVPTGPSRALFFFGSLSVLLLLGVPLHDGILVPGTRADQLARQKPSTALPDTSLASHWHVWAGDRTMPGHFDRPRNLTTDIHGNVYVADTQNHRIQKLSPAGELL